MNLNMMFSFPSLYLLVSLVLLKLTLPAAGQAQSVSTGLSTIIGDKQYYVGTIQKVNWYRAVQLCASIGMSLASIESDTEATNLKNFLYTNALLSDNFWLSGNDLALRQEFIWFDTGNKFKYTKWASGQPRGTAASRCVLTNSKFEWMRAICSHTYYFICAKPLVPVCGMDNRCRYTYS